MTDFLRTKINEIKLHMDDLWPAVAEYERLGEAVKVLNNIGTNHGSGHPVKVETDGNGIAAVNPAQPKPKGRPPGSGKRKAQVLRVVKDKPGLTVPQIADEIGIKQNYLYRVMPRLVVEGLVVKREDDKTWWPA